MYNLSNCASSASAGKAISGPTQRCRRTLRSAWRKRKMCAQKTLQFSPSFPVFGICFLESLISMKQETSVRFCPRWVEEMKVFWQRKDLGKVRVRACLQHPGHRSAHGSFIIFQLWLRPLFRMKPNVHEQEQSYFDSSERQLHFKLTNFLRFLNTLGHVRDS